MKKISFAHKQKVAFVASGGAIKAACFHIGVGLALEKKGLQFVGGTLKQAKKSSGTNGNGAGYVRESDRAADREERAVEKSVEKPVEKEVEFVGDAKAKVRETYEKIRGSKNAILVDIKFDIIRKVSPRDVPRALDYSRQKVFAVIIDGPATSGIIRSCDDFGVKHLGATQFSAVENTRVNLISL